MNDETKATEGNDASPRTGDETFGWTETENEGGASGGAQATAERMLSQLQSMIDSLATQAAPVARQVGIKAAELAAKAADRAGPLAQRAAEATVDASGKLAERSRHWAADLRRDADADEAGSSPLSGSTTAVLDRDETIGTETPLGTDGDAPAEGPRT